jgi:hypothetical protein
MEARRWQMDGRSKPRRAKTQKIDKQHVKWFGVNRRLTSVSSVRTVSGP